MLLLLNCCQISLSIARRSINYFVLHLLHLAIFWLQQLLQQLFGALLLLFRLQIFFLIQVELIYELLKQQQFVIAIILLLIFELQLA